MEGMNGRKKNQEWIRPISGIMLVVFLVIAALAIDIGYMYVSEEDLQNAAETSALAGAQAIKQRIQLQTQTDPDEAEGCC